MSESLRVRRLSPDPSSTHSGHHRPSSGTGDAVDASSRTSAGTGAGVRKPATSGGACCAGDIGGSEGVGRERGRRRAMAPAVEEDAGSRAAPAVEVDLRGWGGMRERRVWSAAAQEKGGGQAGVQGMEELGFVLSVFLYQWSAIRV